MRILQSPISLTAFSSPLWVSLCRFRRRFPFPDLLPIARSSARVPSRVSLNSEVLRTTFVTSLHSSRSSSHAMAEPMAYDERMEQSKGEQHSAPQIARAKQRPSRPLLDWVLRHQIGACLLCSSHSFTSTNPNQPG